MTDAVLRDLAARAAGGDPAARRALTGEARAQARDILAQDRFRVGSDHHDGPLRRLLSWLGDRLHDLAGPLPGGDHLSWLLLAAILSASTAIAVTALVGRRRRAAAARVAGPGDVPGAAALGPVELERRAQEAERSGDLDAAVRLRFAAGLLRLDAARAIELRPSLTSGDVGRAIGSPRYDDLADAHDAIAYGGRPATGSDASAARDGWPVVLREARR